MSCSICEVLFHYATATAAVGVFMAMRRRLNKKREEKEVRKDRLAQARKNGYILSQAMEASVALDLQFTIEKFKKVTDVDKIKDAGSKEVIERVEELHLFYTTSIKDKVWHKDFEGVIKDLDGILNDSLKAYVGDGNDKVVLRGLNQVEYALRRLDIKGLVVD